MSTTTSSLIRIQSSGDHCSCTNVRTYKTVCIKDMISLLRCTLLMCDVSKHISTTCLLEE